MSSEPSQEHERTLSGLSALIDGECGSSESRAAIDAWRRSPELRAAWHRYALIGDVLRSDELAVAPSHDADFVAVLRKRLASEPVVLAPVLPAATGSAAATLSAVGAGALAASAASVRRLRAATMATAASVMVVAGAALVWRGLPDEAPSAGIVASVASPAASDADQVLIELNDGQMQRSPELDRYLSAHRQFSAGPALAAPGGVRQVAVTPDGR